MPDSFAEQIDRVVEHQNSYGRSNRRREGEEEEEVGEGSRGDWSDGSRTVLRLLQGGIDGLLKRLVG